MILFLVLGSFAIFDPFSIKAKKEVAQEKQRRVFWLKDKKLSALRIKSGKLETRFECATKDGCGFDNGSDWFLVAPVADEADPASVASVASTMLNLDPIDHLDIEPDPKEFGFDEPQAELDLYAVGEQEPYGLVFGKGVPTGQEVYARSSREPNRVYIVSSYAASALKKELFHWRNKRFFKGMDPAKVESLEWRAATGNFRLVRGEGGWKIEAPFKARANQLMAEGLAATLAYSAAKGIYEGPRKAIKARPAFSFRAVLGGKEKELELFHAPGAGKPGAKDFIARLPELNTLYLVDAIAFARFGKAAIEYRERRVLDPESKARATELNLYFPREKKRLQLLRAGGEWKAGEGDKPAEALSQARIQAFMEGLGSAEASAFDAKGPNSILFRRTLGDLELEVKNGTEVLGKNRFVIEGRRRALTEGDLPGEVRILGEDFLRVMPARFSDLYESNNKQVVVPEGAKEEGHDGHDHPPGHQH